MEPETKKRRFIRPPPRRKAPEQNDPVFPPTPVMPTVNAAQGGVVAVDPRIQHAKNMAVAQAQQDGTKGNFRLFDSSYGNFMVPVVPTRAELRG